MEMVRCWFRLDSNEFSRYHRVRILQNVCLLVPVMEDQLAFCSGAHK